MAPSDPTADVQLQNWRELRCELVWAYDGQISERDRRLKYTGIPIPAWYLRRGHAVLEFPGRREVVPGNTWYFPPQENGWQTFSPDAELLSVRFYAEWPTGETLFDHTHGISVPAAAAPALLRVGERIARLVRRKFPEVRSEMPTMFASPEDYFEVERLLYGWLIAYTQALTAAKQTPRTLGKLDARVRAVLHQLETRSLNQSVREAELAQGVGLSRSQLNRLFVECMGRTPAEHWEMKRLQAAQSAIVESTQGIKAIAYNLGFSSLPHFSAWVRKRLGKSPRELRKTGIGVGV